MCLWCSKEPSHWDGSSEYQQHMFWLINKKLIFSYELLSWACNLMFYFLFSKTNRWNGNNTISCFLNFNDSFYFYLFSVEPITGETTAMPVTFQPVTHTTAQHGQTTQPRTKTTKPTTAPTTTPKPKSSGFDGGSFAGGIALGAGIAIILYIIYRVYSARKTKDYRTM